MHLTDFLMCWIFVGFVIHKLLALYRNRWSVSMLSENFPLVPLSKVKGQMDGVCAFGMTSLVPMLKLSSGKWFRCTSRVEQITDQNVKRSQIISSVLWKEDRFGLGWPPWYPFFSCRFSLAKAGMWQLVTAEERRAYSGLDTVLYGLLVWFTNAACELTTESCQTKKIASPGAVFCTTCSHSLRTVYSHKSSKFSK